MLLTALECVMNGMALENECKKARQNFEVQSNMIAIMKEILDRKA